MNAAFRLCYLDRNIWIDTILACCLANEVFNFTFGGFSRSPLPGYASRSRLKSTSRGVFWNVVVLATPWGAVYYLPLAFPPHWRCHQRNCLWHFQACSRTLRRAASGAVLQCDGHRIAFAYRLAVRRGFRHFDGTIEVVIHGRFAIVP